MPAVTDSLFSAAVREDRQYFDTMFRKPSDRHVLALFHVGDSAWQYVEKTHNEIIAELLNALDDMFQGQVAKYYIQSPKLVSRTLCARRLFLQLGRILG
jgi:hypothetical protein